MKARTKRDRKRLLANARAVVEKLAQQFEGGHLHIHKSVRLKSSSYTDGWYAEVGSLGRKRPRMEIWLDRFSGYPERKLYAGLHLRDQRKMTAITRRVARRLFPVREIVNGSDTNFDKFLILKKRLSRSEFNSPIHEKHSDGGYFGIYDPTRSTSKSDQPAIL